MANQTVTSSAEKVTWYKGDEPTATSPGTVVVVQTLNSENSWQDAETISVLPIEDTNTSEPTQNTPVDDTASSTASEPGADVTPNPDPSKFANVDTIVTATTTVVKGSDGKSSTSAVIFQSPVQIDEKGATQTISGTSGIVTLAIVDASALSEALGDSSSSAKPAGAIAGAAVGGILGGLLIGCLAAFLFLRKKKQQTPVISYEAPESKSYGPSSLATSPPDALQLTQFMALATPDKELASELGSLGDLIQAHVENNYHLHPVNANSQVLAQALTNLGVGAPEGLTIGDLTSLALEPRTRQPAIQHVLAHVLFTSIDFSAKSRLTMLPAPIAAFLQSVPPVEKIGGNQEAMTNALSRWRVLSAFLLNPTRSIRNTLSPSENAIAPQAHGLVSALNTFLDPFVPDNLRQQQADHLQAVVMECAKFGYTVFSQPSDWKFNFSAQPGYRMAVVCAGLDKLTTNEGQPYNVPNSVAAPTLVQV